MKKVQSAAYLLRRIEVWKKRYELVVDSRRAQTAEVKKYRAQVQDLLERKVRELRTANEGLQAATSTLAANNIEIQELKDQVASQYKQLAEAQSDARVYQQESADAITKHSRLLERLRDKGVQCDALCVEREEMIRFLADARTKLSYRLWIVLRGSYYRTRTAIKAGHALRADRLRAWWAVRRLSAARVKALNEGGYIPRDLVRMAMSYWEQDKARGEMRNAYDFSTVQPWTKFQRPRTMYRQIKTWLGL